MQKSEQQLRFNGVKVFSATLVRDREALGEKVSAWLREKQKAGGIQVTDYIVTQSSDEQFHCITITVFFIEGIEAREPVAMPKPSNGHAPSKPARRLSFKEPE